MKVKIKRQGKTVIEKSGDGSILIMLPNGDVESADTPQQAAAKHKSWARRATGDDEMGMAQIEWRGFKLSEVPT